MTESYSTKAPASSRFHFLLYFWGGELFFSFSPESDPLIAAPTRTAAVSVTHLPDEPTFNVSNVQITGATLESSSAAHGCALPGGTTQHQQVPDTRTRTAPGQARCQSHL